MFPIIVYFLGKDEVKYHAKKSLWTHVIPYLIFGIGIVGSGLLGMNDISHAGPFLIATYALTFLVAIYFFIWNIVKGIKVFSE
ncbi:DUF4870 domain-containing protein [Bacillus safensis]|uniref:DUF4870 domain-containing protein n=1 Tax=Bacillus safensis TaxID=561879 RepID=UPI0033976C3D